MPRPIHFEITANDPEKVVKFYTGVFGWQFMKWDGPMEYWLVTTGGNEEPGINGGLMRRQQPAATTTNVIGISDIDASLASITAAGGQIALPKMHVAGVGWVAYCTDPDGTLFGLIQGEAPPQ